MPEESAEMPKVPFGPHMVSRLIVGSNQQIGAAHNLRDLGIHMAEYFTVERTVDFIRSCLAEGMDTWQANYSEKIRDVLFKLREGGQDIQVIPISAMAVPDLANERLRPMLERMEGSWDKMFEDMKPVGVYLWGMLTDMLWREGKIDRARDFLAKVRDSGVQAGIATHLPEVIEYVEEKGWDVDFYMASLYKWMKSREEILEVLPEVPVDGSGGWEFYLPSELPKMCETISKTPKTCLAFKLFAAGRTARTPEEVRGVFEYVLGHIKPTDAVVVGMYPRFHEQMIKENADLVKQYGQVRETSAPR